MNMDASDLFGTEMTSKLLIARMDGADGWDKGSSTHLIIVHITYLKFIVLISILCANQISKFRERDLLLSLVLK